MLWDATPAAALVRAPVPEALSSISDEEWTCVFRAAPASAQTVYTPIQTDDASWDAFDLDDEESCDAYEDWLEQFGTPDSDDRDNHQLGGFPQTIQSGMQETCQLVANGLYCGNSEVWQTEQRASCWRPRMNGGWCCRSARIRMQAFRSRAPTM